MFALLSNEQKILSSLQSLSPKEFELAKNNLSKLISSLNIDVNDLLTHRKNNGVLLGLKPLSIDKQACLNLSEMELASLITSEQNLINAINTLCLTEAIWVRDTFRNTLEVIAELNPPEQIVVDSVPVNNSPINYSLIKSSPVNNVAPINLIDVKQRLSQALQPKAQQHENIKNKLNSLLTKKKSIELVKQAI